MTSIDRRLTTSPSGAGRRHLAHTILDYRLRLPDLDDVLRAAFLTRIFSDADVGHQSLGPRHIRLCIGVAKPVVGHRPAVRGHDRRPVRRGPGAVRRRAHVRRRPGADVACDQRRGARCFGWRADWIWPRRYVVHDRAGGVRQAAAARVAFARLWIWHGGGFIRSIPVFAGCRRADGCVRLAADSGDFRRRRACHAAALAGAGDAGSRGDQRGRAAIAAAGPWRGVCQPLLCAAGSRLLYLRISACLHHRAHAGLSRRPRLIRDCRRLDAGDDWAVQHRRVD